MDQETTEQKPVPVKSTSRRTNCRPTCGTDSPDTSAGRAVLDTGMLLQLSSARAQVDNLRTNHRGTFVLKDNTFRWLAKLLVDPPPPPGASAPRAVASVSELARDYLVLPCALVRVVGWVAKALQ